MFSIYVRTTHVHKRTHTPTYTHTYIHTYTHSTCTPKVSKGAKGCEGSEAMDGCSETQINVPVSISADLELRGGGRGLVRVSEDSRREGSTHMQTEEGVWPHVCQTLTLPSGNTLYFRQERTAVRAGHTIPIQKHLTGISVLAQRVCESARERGDLIMMEVHPP